MKSRMKGFCRVEFLVDLQYQEDKNWNLGFVMGKILGFQLVFLGVWNWGNLKVD